MPKLHPGKLGIPDFHNHFLLLPFTPYTDTYCVKLDIVEFYVSDEHKQESRLSIGSIPLNLVELRVKFMKILI